MLHARAQRELQAKAVAAQIGRQRAVAVYARVGAAHAFLGSAAVVSAGEGAPAPLSSEGVDIKGQPPARQHTAVGPLAAQLATPPLTAKLASSRASVGRSALR